jgi:hypothetical protein
MVLVLAGLVAARLPAQLEFTSEQDFFGDAPSSSHGAAVSPAPALSAPKSRQPETRRANTADNPGDFLNDRGGWNISALDTAAEANFLSTQKKDVILEMNMARGDPAAYAIIAEAYLGYYQGSLIQLPGQVAIRTSEGQAAVHELIRYLKAARTRAPRQHHEQRFFAHRSGLRSPQSLWTALRHGFRRRLFRLIAYPLLFIRAT